MDLSFVNQFVMENFQQVKVTNGGTHFLFRCPLCGDSKKNPYKKRFNLDWNHGNPGWHCFNCGERGNFITLYSIVKVISYDDANKELYKYEKEEIKRKTREYKKRPNVIEEKEEEKEDFNWIRNKCYAYPWFTPDGMGILEKRYLLELHKFYEERKIPHKYKIYICHSGKYKGRIIIPIFDSDRNIIYFQARRIPGTKIEPKYDNPISPKKMCILHEDCFDRNKPIIITEGLIDAFMIGEQGTSCLGKEISSNLLKYLFNLTDEYLIVALDNDKEAYKSLSKFLNENEYSRKVKYFLYPKEYRKFKDINEIYANNNINIYDMIIENSVSYHSVYIKLRLDKLI